MFDIVYVSRRSVSSRWEKFKKIHPLAIKVENYKDYYQIRNVVFTKNYWCVWDDFELTVADLFSIEVPEWDLQYNNIFGNGVFLLNCSLVTPEEFESKSFKNTKDRESVCSPAAFDRLYVSTYDDYINKSQKITSSAHWLIFDNIVSIDDNIFEKESDYVRFPGNHLFFVERNKEITPVNGIWLLPSETVISKKEFDRRYLVNKIEHKDSYGKLQYPILSVASYEDYLTAVENSNDDMFWIKFPNIAITDESVFDLYFDQNNGIYDIDRQTNHIFPVLRNNEKVYVNGLILASVNSFISKKEFDRRYLINKKEHEQVVGKLQYLIVEANRYEDYLNAVNNSNDDMFWIKFPNVTISDNTVFDLYYDKNNGIYDIDRQTNHIFPVLRNNEKVYVNGLILASSSNKITKKEFDRRYLVNKKEHEQVVGKLQYPIFKIDSYTDYLNAVNNSNDDMFWCYWNDISVTDNTVFDLYYDPNNGKYDVDRNTNHVFPVLRNNEKIFLNGLWLCSTSSKISRKEFDRRYLINKKEIDTIAGKLRYPIIEVDSYSNYIKAKEKVTSDMIWIKWSDIEITDSSVFDLYYDPNNGKYDVDRSISHTYRTIINGEESTSYNLALIPSSISLSEKEVKHRYVMKRKDENRVVAKVIPYDIVFISYNEPNADDLYNELLSRFPGAKRVSGIKGIHNAHKKAAEMSDTSNFWVVDGDSKILDSFDFSLSLTTYEKDIVHIWYSRNPVNGLEYGYGGVKLLPKQLTLNLDKNSIDMTTSISRSVKVMNDVSNYTMFNTSELAAWRSGFREAAKLSSGVVNGSLDRENEERLRVWCTVNNNAQFGEYAVLGAIAGKEFGTKYKDTPDILKNINNFEWLNEQFRQRK